MKSHLAIGMALLLVVSLLSQTGCRRVGDDQGQRPLTPAEIVSRSAEAMRATNSFHFILEHENGTTPIALNLQMERAEGDIVRPDRLSADVVAKLSGVTARVKVIGIGDRTWITNPFNQNFQQLPGDASVRQIFDPGGGVGRIVESLKDPSIAGQERLDGVDCYVIEGIIDSGELRPVAPAAEPGHTVRVRLLTGKNDFLARSIRLDGPLAANEPSTIARKVALSRFNEQITITPPQ